MGHFGYFQGDFGHFGVIRGRYWLSCNIFMNTLVDLGHIPVNFWHFGVILGCFGPFSAVYRGISAVYDVFKGSIGCGFTFSVISWSFLSDVG